MIYDALLILISFSLGAFVMAFVYVSVIMRKPARVKEWADCGQHYTPKRAVPTQPSPARTPYW